MQTYASSPSELLQQCQQGVYMFSGAQYTARIPNWQRLLASLFFAAVPLGGCYVMALQEAAWKRSQFILIEKRTSFDMHWPFYSIKPIRWRETRNPQVYNQQCVSSASSLMSS